jgi:Holliday junction resolvase RusA-like endonuclease
VGTGRMIVSFHAPGLPISQGSKRHVGGGRMIESSRKLAPWRANVAQSAAAAMGDKPLLDEPLWMAVMFSFWRPQAHYRTGKYAEMLKPSAPAQPITYPDIEKLVRAVNDAIEGIVFRNDSQVVRLFAEKVYDKQLGASVVLGPLDDPLPERLLTAADGDIHHAASVMRMVGMK